MTNMRSQKPLWQRLTKNKTRQMLKERNKLKKGLFFAALIVDKRPLRHPPQSRHFVRELEFIADKFPYLTLFTATRLLPVKAASLNDSCKIT